MPFNEVEILRANLAYLTKALELSVEVCDASEFADDKGKLPVPSKPVLVTK